MQIREWRAARRIVHPIVKPTIAHEDIRVGHAGARDRRRVAASRLFQAGIDRTALGIVHSDDCGLTRVLALKKPALGRDVPRHASVTVEVVGAQIEQHRNIGSQRRSEIDLVGGQLNHVSAVAGQLREVKNRYSDIAANSDRNAARLKQMARQNRRCGFSVGAGNRRDLADGFFAGKQFDIPDDVAIRIAGRDHERMRRRMVKRDPRT